MKNPAASYGVMGYQNRQISIRNLEFPPDRDWIYYGYNPNKIILVRQHLSNETLKVTANSRLKGERYLGYTLNAK